MAGHDEFQPRFVKNTTGGKFAAPLWETIMNSIHVDLESKEFYDRVPDGVVRFTVWRFGQKSNGELCSEDISGHKLVTEWFPKMLFQALSDVCDMHVQIEGMPLFGKPLLPYCPVDHRGKASAILLPRILPIVSFG